jgi:hypothetical protein
VSEVGGSGCFHPQVKGKKTPTQLGHLERANLNHRATTVTRTSKIVQHVSQALLRDRIHFHWRYKPSQIQKIQELKNFLKSSMINCDRQRIFTAVESSFRKIFNKQKHTHNQKFSALNIQQDRPTPVSASNKFVLNLSEHVLTDAEEAVLVKGLNFSVTYPHSNMDMACASSFRRLWA